MENWRAGIVASTVARVHGNRNSTPENYYPVIGQPVDVDMQSQEDQMQILMASGRSGKPS